MNIDTFKSYCYYEKTAFESFYENWYFSKLFLSMKKRYIGILSNIEKYVGFAGIPFKVIINCGVFKMIFMVIS